MLCCQQRWVCCTQDMGVQGMQREQGCCRPLHLSVPTWADQDRNKEILCPPWSRGAASVHGAVRRRQTNRGVQLLCQPTSTLWERFLTPSLPGAVHQRLWDRRGDLSTLRLPSPLDFLPATFISSLGEHKIGLLLVSEPMGAVHGYPALLDSQHHQHSPPPPLTQQRDNTEPRLG